MKLRITAVGRVKSGPERDLVDDYTGRGTATGRAIGLGPLSETEIDNRSLKSAREESRALAAGLHRTMEGAHATARQLAKCT